MKILLVENTDSHICQQIWHVLKKAGRKKAVRKNDID